MFKRRDEAVSTDELYRMLFEAAHDNDKAAPFAVQRTVAAFGHQWAEIPSGKFMLSDPIFKGEVDQIITRQEVLLNRSWFPGKRVLDAGCGGGRWSYGLAKLGAQLTAADTNPSAIAATRAAVEELGAKADFVLTNLEAIDAKLPLESFDLVWCWGVLHHCTSFTGSLRALSRLVKQGGLIHLYLYGRESIPTDADIELFKERMRYNFAPNAAAREAFLTEKMAGHGLDRHHVHDIYAPIINRRFYFEEVETMLESLGFKALPRPIEHSEVWITAIKGGESEANAFRLPKHPPPYWFQRP